MDYEQRAEKYRHILEVSEGTLFISGISMSGLLSESINLLHNKLVESNKVKLLLMDPLFAQVNKDLMSFNNRISEDINKSLEILKSLCFENLEVRLYRNFMPIVTTGYESDERVGNLVYEIMDYFKGSEAPIFSVPKIEKPSTFETIKNKFYFYWDNSRTIGI